MYIGSELWLLGIAAAALSRAWFRRFFGKFGKWLNGLIAGWITFDLIFWAWGKSRYLKVNRCVEVPLDIERAEIIKERFLELAGFMPFDPFLRGWFNGCLRKDILRDNVLEFFAYSLYCRRPDNLPSEVRVSLCGYLFKVEKAFGQTFMNGYNPSATFMAHLWEPLRSQPTPLLAQVICEAAATSTSLMLLLLGFRKHTCLGVVFWVRQPPICSQKSPSFGADEAEQTIPMQSRPIVFIHGVGFGLLLYLGFLRNILKAVPQHPLILLDMPHVALRLGQRAVGIDAITNAIPTILSSQGYADACFFGHSFGTFCVSRVCQNFPTIVHSMMIADPVCCLTCHPQLLANFIYKAPTLAGATSSVLGFTSAVRFVISRDLIIAETFCRQFLWHQLMLWPEDMPLRSVVSLAANDDLVPADLVRSHLQHAKSSAIVLFHPSAGHGGFLLDKQYQELIADHIRGLLR